MAHPAPASDRKAQGPTTPPIREIDSEGFEALTGFGVQGTPESAHKGNLPMQFPVKNVQPLTNVRKGR